MKRLKCLLIIGILACVTGCQKQSPTEQPVNQDTNEVEQIIEETTVEAVEENVDEGLSDIFEESDSETTSFMDFNYDEVDTKELSEETLELFAPCAIYLESGSNTDNEDLLSSMEWDDIEEFLIYFISIDNENVEFMHDYDGGAEISTKQWRIKYEEWDYLLREVIKEKDPKKLGDMMHTEFVGEMEVYYSPDDDYIYMEVGAIGWDYKKAKVREVNREGDSYIITYDLYSDFSDMLAPYSTVDVTIVESDNKYGYSLVSVVAIK